MRRPASKTLLCLCALACLRPAMAADMHGADLVPSNYETLSGTYTNVGEFRVGAGLTVFVGQGAGLYVYAATVTIQGSLNANGRGYAGGANGAVGGAGFAGGNGFGPGAGGGGAAGYGGGGGGYGNADGTGSAGGAGDVPASGGGAGGGEYGSTATLTIPLSADDIFLGSGGGGGGGGDSATTSGAGGSGGGLIYLEAGYITVSGTITANGLDGGAGLDTNDCVTVPGGGGGGAGGGISVTATRNLSLSNSLLAANGGLGGAAICSDVVNPYAGGGGAGGRIKLLYNTASFTAVTISTSSGKGGAGGLFLPKYAQDGSSGTVSFGILPSSPAAFAVADVFTSSISYSWGQPPDWGGPASAFPDLTAYQFRLYESTKAVPLSDFYTGVSVSSGIAGASETGLSPDTYYQRFLTAHTDYGDGPHSETVSTHTFAAAPLAEAQTAFPAAAADSLTFAWSSGTASTGYNPAYTTYEVSRSTRADFSADVSAGFITALSSSPAGLPPNTTHYFRVRALGLNAAYTDFTLPLSTVTLAALPESPAFQAVHVDSLAFVWSAGANPAGTRYEAQLSTDNFLSLSSAALTEGTAAQFGGLNPGSAYHARVRAVNHSGVATAFTATISTTAGQLGDLETPGTPEPPDPRSGYSYDGSAEFVWYPPSGSVAVYRYWLEIGTTPGGNDFLAVYPTSALSYSTTTLVSGKTYYARVRAESTAGILGDFSAPGSGVSVWISQSVAAVAKPYNWPNPFDPAAGPTNIGFNIDSAAHVSLKIFTLQGALVYETSAYEGSGGNKVWRWNGRNGSGRTVEPGGYVGLITKRYSGRTVTQKLKLAVLY